MRDPAAAYYTHSAVYLSDRRKRGPGLFRGINRRELDTPEGIQLRGGLSSEREREGEIFLESGPGMDHSHTYHDDEILLQWPATVHHFRVFDAFIMKSHSRRFVTARPVHDPVAVQEISLTFVHQGCKKEIFNK